MITILMFAEEIAVLAIALVTLGIAAHAGRREGSAARTSVPAIAASLLTVVAVVIFYGVRFWTSPAHPAGWRYAIVLAGAAVALLLLALTTRSARSAKASAELDFTAVDLTPRRAWAYGKTWWLVSWLVLALLLIATVVIAGLVASPDTAGRAAAITIEAGTTTASTNFPGWFYGLPVLIAFVPLGALTLVAMSRVSGLLTRADNSQYVLAARRAMVRRIMGISTGAIAFTLGTLWLFIARSSSLAAQFPTTGGRVDVVTSFAALQIPLNGIGLVLCGVGLGVMAATGTVRTPQPETENVPAQERQDSNVH